jgi:hypothetical protein
MILELNYTYSLKEEVIIYIYIQYCGGHLERMNGEKILESSMKHNVEE